MSVAKQLNAPENRFLSHMAHMDLWSVFAFVAVSDGWDLQNDPAPVVIPDDTLCSNALGTCWVP